MSEIEDGLPRSRKEMEIANMLDMPSSADDDVDVCGRDAQLCQRFEKSRTVRTSGVDEHGEKRRRQLVTRGGRRNGGGISTYESGSISKYTN